MATRQETWAKREALKTHLREISQQATGETRLMPTVRQLAAQWNLSVNLVLEAQRELVDEGVLRIAPRVGSYVGQSEAVEKVFLLVFGPEPMEDLNQLLPKAGFEDRMAQLGGAVLTLNVQDAINLEKRGELPSISGVFDYTSSRAQSSVWLDATLHPTLPRVRFGGYLKIQDHTDFVGFEDEKGGWQATRHLLARKHQRIAFLAYHLGSPASSLTHWSFEREQGWKKALEEAGFSAKGLAFHPRHEQLSSTTGAIRQAMREPIAEFVAQEGITAVVTANDTIAMCLLDALQEAGRPAQSWPSIVSFDGGTNLDSHILTSLRTPWDELGRTAADLLWARAHNLLSGPSQYRRIAMRLIPRLSCHSNSNYAVAHTSLTVAARIA